MIDDNEWEEFCLWWSKHWSPSKPNRASVEKYLEWKDEQIKSHIWKWEKEGA